jgi:hypothetical protein
MIGMEIRMLDIEILMDGMQIMRLSMQITGCRGGDTTMNGGVSFRPALRLSTPPASRKHSFCPDPIKFLFA